MKDFFNTNFFLRLISAIVLSGITVFCVTKGNVYFSVFILTIAIISYLEWFTVASSNLEEKQITDYRKHIMFWGILGLLVILPCSISMIYMKYIVEIEKIIYLIAIIVATDIGAYIFGRIIKGPRLAPSISPGKTISGSLCGLIIACIVALLLQFFHYINIDYNKLTIITIILSILSQAGDLFESWFKRHFGVKDSSNLIPGHGGFLDRIDSFIFTGPIFAIINLLGYF